MTRLPCDQIVINFVRILEKSPFRRARRTRAVAVISSPVTRAHKQTRLRKPPHWAAQVRTVDCKNLELITFNSPHPACRVPPLALGRPHIGDLEGSKPN